MRPSMPTISDYPVYHDDYHRRYNNSGFEPKKAAQNLTPIIVFSNESKASAKRSPIGRKSSLTPRNVLKTVFILFCVGMALFQTIDIFKKYSSFPMDVNVVVDEMKLLQFPAVTLCNNNVVRKAYLLQEFPHLRQQLGDSVRMTAIVAFSQTIAKQREDVENYTKHWIQNTTLNKTLDFAPELTDFVKKMECDTQYDPEDKTTRKIKCSDKAVITSLQKDGICFTYFHQMARIEKRPDNCRLLGTCSKSEVSFDTNEIIRFELDFEPKEYTSWKLPISGRISIHDNTEVVSFDTNEIIRFELDFEPKEYTSWKLPISGRISIHDNTEVGNSLSNSYNLEPGFYYQFYIKRQSTRMLKTPYATNCFDYVQSEGRRVNATQDFSIPLSRKSVSIAMHIRLHFEVHDRAVLLLAAGTAVHSQQRSGRQPLALVVYVALPRRLVLCCVSRALTMSPNYYGMCWDKAKRMQCSMRCQPSCWQDHYELSVQKLPFEYYGKKGWDSGNEAKRNRSSVVSIRYWTTEHTIHKYSPLFAILDMICYVGGVVSMYTGISLIAISDFFILSFFVLKKKYTKSILLSAKKKRGFTFGEMAAKLDQNPIWLTAAIFGEQPFDAATAARALQLLHISDDRVLNAMQEIPETRGQSGDPLDPFEARLHELLRVYSPSLKALVHEMCGNGIMSAIDCRLAIDVNTNGHGVQRVILTIDSKFLEFKKF
ncbi:unnamed protein product, partial [Medioppia subpectinata]